MNYELQNQVKQVEGIADIANCAISAPPPNPAVEIKRIADAAKNATSSPAE